MEPDKFVDLTTNFLDHAQPLTPQAKRYYYPLLVNTAENTTVPAPTSTPAPTVAVVVPPLSLVPTPAPAAATVPVPAPVPVDAAPAPAVAPIVADAPATAVPINAPAPTEALSSGAGPSSKLHFLAIISTVALGIAFRG